MQARVGSVSEERWMAGQEPPVVKKTNLVSRKSTLFVSKHISPNFSITSEISDTTAIV